MAHAALEQTTVLEILQKLIATPSVNPSLAPAEGTGEAAIARVACEWMERHGIRNWMEEVAPGRANAIGEVGKAEAPCVVFCAHLDTVSTAGMTIPPFEPVMRDGRVYGRGSYDMKGSAAAILSGAAALAAEDFPGRVMVALVADEEYASIGAQHFVQKHKADACVMTEPSEGRLVLAHKGFVWAEIRAKGRAAHGSRWDLGISAIAKMGRIITALEEFDRDVLRRRVHALVGPASQHCSVIHGGTGLSTYAEECVLQVERRTLPGETPEQVMRELTDIIAKTGAEAETRLLLTQPPLTCDREATIAKCVRRSAALVNGAEPEEIGVSYWMDAALFAAAGIPTVNYGPGGAGAHEAVEWVELDSVVKCAHVLVETARQFCGAT
ncbi:MAG TPA: ArgE/DapE family deacylase [Candidatus Acidoferrales bacterium]|nr:ArgE/DapE family deacylase [Candidatus Acidoferrales bacterium]